MTGGAEGEEEKQGLSDAELRRKTAAHSGLAVFPKQGLAKGIDTIDIDHILKKVI